MPKKAGAKPIWTDGEIHAAFKARLAADGWRWGITKKVESLMQDYAQRPKESLNRGLIGDVQIEVLPKPGESGLSKPKESPDRTHERKHPRYGK